MPVAWAAGTLAVPEAQREHQAPPPHLQVLPRLRAVHAGGCPSARCPQPAQTTSGRLEPRPAAVVHHPVVHRIVGPLGDPPRRAYVQMPADLAVAALRRTGRGLEPKAVDLTRLPEQPGVRWELCPCMRVGRGGTRASAARAGTPRPAPCYTGARRLESADPRPGAGGRLPPTLDTGASPPWNMLPWNGQGTPGPLWFRASTNWVPPECQRPPAQASLGPRRRSFARSRRADDEGGPASGRALCPSPFGVGNRDAGTPRLTMGWRSPFVSPPHLDRQRRLTPITRLWPASPVAFETSRWPSPTTRAGSPTLCGSWAVTISQILCGTGHPPAPPIAQAGALGRWQAIPPPRGIASADGA